MNYPPRVMAFDMFSYGMGDRLKALISLYYHLRTHRDAFAMVSDDDDDDND